MMNLKQSGIYQICNLINEKVYVGSAKNINQRWKAHRNDLKKGKHHSYHLQKAWDIYGEENFKFEVLEIVSDLEKLIEREQYWIDTYQSSNVLKGYNINPTAGSQLGRKLSDESKLKMLNSSNSKTAIVQLDIYGNVISEFPSITNAIKETKISNTTIRKSLKNKTFVKGHAWLYKSDFYSESFNFNQFFPKESIPKDNYIIKNKSNKVVQLDGLGNIIKIWKSSNEAGKTLNFSTTCITNCCKGKSLDYKNYIWRYLDETEIVTN